MKVTPAICCHRHKKADPVIFPSRWTLHKKPAADAYETQEGWLVWGFSIISSPCGAEIMEAKTPLNEELVKLGRMWEVVRWYMSTSFVSPNAHEPFFVFMAFIQHQRTDGYTSPRWLYFAVIFRPLSYHMGSLIPPITIICLSIFKRPAAVFRSMNIQFFLRLSHTFVITMFYVLNL